MFDKSPLTHPKLNIPVSLPVKGEVVCLWQDVTKMSSGLLAAARGVFVPTAQVLRRKKSGIASPLLST